MPKMSLARNIKWASNGPEARHSNQRQNIEATSTRNETSWVEAQGSAFEYMYILAYPLLCKYII